MMNIVRDIRGSVSLRGIGFLWAVLFLLPPAASPQQNAVTLIFEKEGGRSIIIGAFQRNNVTYISLNDLISLAKLNSYENHEARKLELKLPGYRVKVTAGNPYLIITDGTRQSVVQLPRNVLYAARSYFLPLDAPGTTLPLLLNTSAYFDPTGRSIRIGAGPSTTYDIAGIRFEPKANGTLIRIAATKRLPDVESWLRRDNWLYVTIPDARADTTAINAIKPSGIIRRIVAIQTPTSIQLAFRLSGKIAMTELVREESSNDLLLAVREEGTEERQTPAEAKREPPAETKQEAPTVITKEPPVVAKHEPPPAVKKEPPVQPQRDLPVEPKREQPADLNNRRDRWNLDVIVIDPGHGGRDGGTVGITGLLEKDVALGVGLKLGRLIERNLPDVKVVYTRKDDRFIQLDRRGQIANEARGKLFISIHANSMPRKPSPTRGFEVYLLRPGRTEEAVAIAERENSVVRLEEGYEDRYQDLNDENFILVTMAQSAYVKASEQFADLLQYELDRHTSIPNRGVKQAGFFVLVGASMPNVLIETGYVSNRAEERILRSSEGQVQIAEAVFRAVKRYKEEYERLLEEGRELGSR